jgi:oxygen-independent coproporphyrinogen-3 oxidase
MKANLQKYALADVPRYTSYPTAVQFAGGFQSDTWATWLAELDSTTSLSAYVHVPFCHKLCWYCGCNTSVPNGYDRAQRYASTLLHEIDLTAAALQASGSAVEHLHFGGGTPTYLRERELAAIVTKIDGQFGLASDAEIAIEIDPRSVDGHDISALAGLGFNRVSFGVQDFAQTVQEKINRIQPADMVGRCVDGLRRAGVEAINFDLMYGLPGQTLASVRDTARQAADMLPSRIAVFGYAHVPWFAKHQRMISDADLPGVTARYQQATAIGETLIECGYIEIGLDHYARPDDELAQAQRNHNLRRNFQGYTTDVSDALIGFGASSISQTVRGFAQNARDTLNWSNAIDAGKLPVTRGLARSNEDRLRGDIIEQLMCYLTVDVEAVCHRHAVQVGTLRPSFDQLAELIDDGLVEISGWTVTVPKKHKLFIRTAATAFDAYYTATESRHAKAV